MKVITTYSLLIFVMLLLLGGKVNTTDHQNLSAANKELSVNLTNLFYGVIHENNPFNYQQENKRLEISLLRNIDQFHTHFYYPEQVFALSKNSFRTIQRFTAGLKS